MLVPNKFILGERAELVCNIENVNGETSWRRVDGGPLPENSHLNGGTLYIDETGEDAAGQYECTINQDGEVIPIARTELIIIRLPKITFHPSMPMTVRSGDNVVIHCNVTGDQPIRVQWHNENNRALPP